MDFGLKVLSRHQEDVVEDIDENCDDDGYCYYYNDGTPANDYEVNYDYDYYNYEGYEYESSFFDSVFYFFFYVFVAFWNVGIVGGFEVFLASQLGLWLFLPAFFEDNEVE